MKELINILILSLFFSPLASAQQTPAEVQNQAVTIEGATAHLGNGTIIEES